MLLRGGKNRPVSILRHSTHLTNFWFYMVILTVVGVALALVINESRKATGSLKKEEEGKLCAIIEGSDDTIMLLTKKCFFDQASRVFLDSVGRYETVKFI